MKRFVAVWGTGYDPVVAVRPATWFNASRGYPSDIQADLARLQVSESFDISDEGGYHAVMRIEDQPS